MRQVCWGHRVGQVDCDGLSVADIALGRYIVGGKFG